MPYTPSQADISDVRAYQDAGDLTLRWTSAAPAGTWYQVYLDGRLAWCGPETECVLPVPGGRRRVAADVVAIDRQDAAGDFSEILAQRTDRARLSWQSDPTVVTYRIYSSAAPGGAVSYAAPVATIPALKRAAGWGEGGFGWGGWGSGALVITWVSPPLAGGVWTFGIAAVSEGGEEGAAAETAVTIEAPPTAPPYNAAGLMLTAAYNPGTQAVTLGWLASS